MRRQEVLDWPFKQHAMQLIGGVTSIDVCAASPYNYCVSAGTRLHVYDGATSVAKRQITRFKDKAYSGSFRGDGRLIVAGGEDSVVQLFDSNSRTLLRQFKGHKAPVHVAKFAADQLHVVTAGDDGLLMLWDITSGQQVGSLSAHTDYIRSAAVNPATPDVWATSSYDHECKLWDMRQSRCLAAMDHGAPIESVAFFPSGSLLVTAGGTDICIWQMMGRAQLVHKISAHQKTATSVLVAPLAGEEPHIVSAGLDGHVKVYDTAGYRPFTVHKYPVPVLSLAASPAANLLAVGMADGTLSVHRSREKEVAKASSTRLRWRPVRAVGARSYYTTPGVSRTGARDGDAAVTAQPKVAVSRHNELLLKFRFTEALDAALTTQRHEAVESVLESLHLHGALEATLINASADVVASLLQHIRRQLSRPRHAGNCAALALTVLGACPLVTDGTMAEQLQQLQGAVLEELRTQEQLMTVQGVVAALISSAGCTG